MRVYGIISRLIGSPRYANCSQVPSSPRGPREVTVRFTMPPRWGCSSARHHQRHGLVFPRPWPAHSAPPSLPRDLTTAPGIPALVMRGIFLAAASAEDTTASEELSDCILTSNCRLQVSSVFL